MRLKYFIEYRFEEKVGQFIPIGIWVQDQDDLGIDMYYPDETSDEYWETQWLINRLVESDLNQPPDFLEFHQGNAGYCGMRSRVFEEDTDINVENFMVRTLKKFVSGE